MYFPSPHPCRGSGSGSTMTIQRRSSTPGPCTLFLKTPISSTASPSSQPNPAAIRNRAGHIIKSCLKRSACRPASLQQQQPTAVPVPRFVHFEGCEHIRWFHKTEPPKSASCDPVFVDTNTLPPKLQAVGAQKSSVPVLTPIRKPTPSFSVFELSPVVLESVSYAAGTLSGTIKVHNLAFEKSVTVRITMDNWRSFEDVPATFIRSIIGVDGSRPGVDRFRFNMAVLQLTSNESVDISMCVCYRTNGQEFWDNNSGINYIFKLAYAHTADGLDTTLAKPKQSLDTMSSPKRTPAFSYSFGSVATTATNASALSQPSSLPTSASAVSGADARRYMRYSEAKFAAVSPFNHSMQSSTQAFLQESCATRGSAYAMDYLYRMHSPMRTPSPIMRTGSPLLNMPWTSSAQLLHC